MPRPPFPTGELTGRWGPLTADLALALLVAGVSLLSFLRRASLMLDTEDGPVHFTAPDALGGALVVLGCAALAARRSFPGTVLVVCLASSAVWSAEAYRALPIPYALLVATYTVAQGWPLRRSAAALLLVAGCVGLSAVIFSSPSVEDEVPTEVVAVAVAWVLGRGVRSRQARTQLLEERASLLEEGTRRLRNEKAAAAALASARERANLARDLHDIVASNVGVMVTRAALARSNAATTTEARAALAFIEGIGREALADMRRLVSILTPVEAEPNAHGPASLDKLDELVANMGAAGVLVDLEVCGARRRLPAGLELDAYRIIQESLTNAMKHAEGSRVDLRVDFGPDRLRLVVRDFGGGSPATSPGSGLTGMRQRVSLLGGSMYAGPAGDGGFVTEVVLPVPGPGEAP